VRFATKKVKAVSHLPAMSNCAWYHWP